MSWVDDAVGSFMRDLGLPPRALPETGALELAFERRGTLALERAAADDLLLYLRRTWPSHMEGARLMRALLRCHWREGRSPPVRLGLKDQQAVLLMRLPAREVTPAAVARGLDELVRLMDEIERG